KVAVWRQSTTSFANVAVYSFGPILDNTNPRDPQPIHVGRISVDFFRLFGARLAQGRTFAAVEDRPGGPHVAIVGDRFWHHQLGGSPQVLGQTVSLDGDPFVIVGVLEDGFDTAGLYPSPIARPDVWMPLQLDP